MEQKHWRKLSGQRITIPIRDEVQSVLVREQQASNTMRVCIGTDSQVKKSK